MGQEFRQYCKSATGLSKDVHEVRCTGLFLRKVGAGEKILTFQILDQRMCRVVASRRAFERVAAKGASSAQRLGRRDPPPALWMLYNGVANLGERLTIRTPQATCDKHQSWLEV